MPSVGFKTQTVHDTVSAGALRQRRRGVHTVDYLTIEHDAGLDLRHELILSRDDVTGRYEALPVTPPSGDDDQLPVDAVSRDLYVIKQAQFERPFDYSSSTFGVPPDDVTPCPPRNASKLRSARAPPPQRTGNDVSVFITRDLDSGAFHYFLQAPDSPPYFRFTVPGN